MIFRPDDYRALTSIQDSLKEVSVTDKETEHVAEETRGSEEPEDSKEETEITATEEQTSMSTIGSGNVYWLLYL